MRWIVRPVICLATLGIAGAMMVLGLMEYGNADVVPAWFQAVVGGSVSWFFLDRTLTHRLGDKEKS